MRIQLGVPAPKRCVQTEWGRQLAGSVVFRFPVELKRLLRYLEAKRQETVGFFWFVGGGRVWGSAQGQLPARLGPVSLSFSGSPSEPPASPLFLLALLLVGR